MAGAHCATTISFLPPPSRPPPPPRKPVKLLSSISSPFPSKSRRRKNHLRQKLLKTLKRPVIPKIPPTNPVVPFESPHEQHPEPKESETGELQISTSETAGILSGDFGNFSTRSVFNLGLYLVGAFVFHTVCAVWVFGSVKSGRKDENLDNGSKTRVLELGVNGNNEVKSGVLFPGSELGSVGGSELEGKIVEIQAMAREAREREKLGLKVNGLDNDDDVLKTGIEKEVDSKLVKLRKRLQNRSEKSRVLPVNLRKDGEIDDGVNKPLMYKKKYKFRSSSANVSDKPKGFKGSEDHSITSNRNSSSVGDGDESVRSGSFDNGNVYPLDEEQQLDPPNGGTRGSVSLPLEEVSGRKPSKEKSKSFQSSKKKLGNERAKKAKLGKGNGVAKPGRGFGATQENGLGRPLVKAVKSRKSTMGSKPAAGKVEDKQSDDKADLWWLHLPYVLAIFMRRGHDGEGPKGLFCIKTTPYIKDEGNSSHTVAFEDSGDAKNFCYLLESFFEDLGDFSAEIVPLSIKELDEAVSSDSMKVIVVKKGQLKLYAGQPLAEVEIALCSLVR